jgi:hypothetical protein
MQQKMLQGVVDAIGSNSRRGWRGLCRMARRHAFAFLMRAPASGSLKIERVTPRERFRDLCRQGRIFRLKIGRSYVPHLCKIGCNIARIGGVKVFRQRVEDGEQSAGGFSTKLAFDCCFIAVRHHAFPPTSPHTDGFQKPGFIGVVYLDHGRKSAPVSG